MGLEIGSWNGPGAQGRQVLRLLLAVDERDAFSAAQADERSQRHLGGVCAVGEHGLAVEHATEVDAVKAANQLAVYPGLDAVDTAGCGQALRTGLLPLQMPALVGLLDGRRRS